MTRKNDFCKLHITNHSDDTKMEGFKSLSTSCAMNDNCKKNATVKGSICEKCYARTTLKMRKGLDKNLAENTEILNSRVLDFAELPSINDIRFRFESFGDLNSTTQFINYLNICKKNPYTTFSIWTKCFWIMAEVFDMGYEKPENLIIIISPLMVNKTYEIDKFPYADKIFTTYTADFAIENNITINCGSRHCIDCLRCYDKNNKEIYINEVVKSQQSKYYKMLNN